jgi:RNA-directed DNA polymerase
MFAADTGKRTKDGKPIWLRLVSPADTKIVRHRRIKVEANPFDPNWRPYFEDRAVFKKFGVHLHKNKSVVKPASPQNGAL